MDVKKAGTWALDIAYFKAKAGLYEDGMTGLQILSDLELLDQNGHFWLATGDVAVAKNTYVHGEYAFGHSVDNDKGAKGNGWTLSLNYKF